MLCIVFESPCSELCISATESTEPTIVITADILIVVDYT